MQRPEGDPAGMALLAEQLDQVALRLEKDARGGATMVDASDLLGPFARFLTRRWGATKGAIDATAAALRVLARELATGAEEVAADLRRYRRWLEDQPERER